MKKNKVRCENKPSSLRKKRLSILDKAELAFKEAIKNLVIEYRKQKRSLIVYEDGKVKEISPNDVDISKIVKNEEMKK